MAFRFGDPGGRGYNAVGTSNVNLIAWWSGIQSQSAGVWSVAASQGRNGGSSLRMSANNSTFGVYKVLTSQATWGCALAHRFVTLPSGANLIEIIQFIDVATNQVNICVNSLGQLIVRRGTTVLGTSTATVAGNTWNHYEFKATINSSTGTAELRLNGTVVVGPLTSQNTQASANASANIVAIGDQAGSSNALGPFDYDDIIFYDGQANDPQGNPDIHDFIGDCSLIWLLPNGAGTTTQFTPDSGNNYARVNEATPDGDTSYVEDANVGDIDTYAMADLPGSTATVKSLAVVSYTRKSDVSSRGMKHEIRTNSTNVAHTTEYILSDSYQYFMSTWGQNPTGTPADWTVADVNALEAGLKVSS